MAATRCSVSHASFSPAAHGSKHAHSPLCFLQLSAFKLQRSYFPPTPAITLFRKSQQKIPPEAERFNGICARLGATPASSSGSSSDALTSLVIAIAIPLVSGTLASLFNAFNIDWYKSLRKPAWNPPSWLFGGAWSLLYCVMGFASWLVWVQGGWEVQGFALTLYGVQLILNLAWPVLFFGAKQMRVALVDIIALWVSLFACIYTFQGINQLAARLLYPYLAWVTFASALNYSYLRLNSA